MKKLTFIFLLVISQFAIAQSGDDVNTMYIECNGDSIAVDISQFANFPPEMLFEMFDCSDVDDWSWGDDSIDVNNPWDDNDWPIDFEPEDSLENILDCDGQEAPSNWIADGFCDNWSGANFNCEEFDFDGGDCDDQNNNGFDDSTDVNNPWDNEDDDFWDFDSTDVNNPWGDEDLLFEMVCSNGDVFEVSLSDMMDSSEDLIASLCGENGVDEDWNGPDWDDDFWDFDSTDVNNPWDDEDDDFWDFDSTDVNNPWDEEELAFDCINSSPEAFELYLSCMNGDEGACEALEILCGEEEEEEEEEEEWGDDIDALIEQLENDCASQVDLGWSCGILEMINDCMSGNEEACEELEVLYDENEEEEQEWGDDIDALIEQLEIDCASQNDLGMSCGILEMINACMSGDEEACEELEEIYEDFDFEEEDEENEEEEEEWSWGEGENMGALFDVISSISVTENELVLVLEANDLIVSVFDESGFEFSPSVVDGYMVFGPFDIDELYNIIVENMDDLEVLWGLFKPMASDVELFEEGVISALDSNFGDIFNLNSMLSVDEIHHDIKVYNTQYYDVMGRQVSKPSTGLYIEVQTTNLGEISTKKFIQK